MFRTDAAGATEIPHIDRCRAIAAAAPWAEAQFVFTVDDGTISALNEEGLGATRVDGLDGTVAAARGAAALVVATDVVGRSDLNALAAPGRVLVVIDDSAAFPLTADLVVNAAANLQAPANHERRYLLGPSFALLDAEFATAPARDWAPLVDRALLALGSAAPAGLLALLAASARSALPDAHLDVVVGPSADMLLVHRALRTVDGVALHRAPRDMRALMLSADLAVCGGGGTLLELAATATPCVAVCLGQNERSNLVGFESAKAILFAGAAHDRHLPAAVASALAALRADRERRRTLGERARGQVDGRGAGRVARAIMARVRVAGREHKI